MGHRTVSGGAPDSVRCARLTLVKRPLSGIRRRRSAKIHRTCPVRQRLPHLQRSASPFKEGNRAPDSVRCAPDSVRCAPDCPVRPMTEGKISLPELLSTAPSCLGAIKGTPRRMEEHTKHSYNIPKHQDIDSAPLILCNSN